MTTRRKFLMGAAALATIPAAARAQQLSLGAISGYLNQLQTAQGGFTQINGDGTLSTGQIFIKRPGRIRFEYNPPTIALSWLAAVRSRSLIHAPMRRQIGIR